MSVDILLKLSNLWLVEQPNVSNWSWHQALFHTAIEKLAELVSHNQPFLHRALSIRVNKCLFRKFWWTDCQHLVLDIHQILMRNNFSLLWNHRKWRITVFNVMVTLQVAWFDWLSWRWCIPSFDVNTRKKQKKIYSDSFKAIQDDVNSGFWQKTKCMLFSRKYAFDFHYIRISIVHAVINHFL